jgi:hypothetical protein
MAQLPNPLAIVLQRLERLEVENRWLRDELAKSSGRGVRRCSPIVDRECCQLQADPMDKAAQSCYKHI